MKTIVCLSLVLWTTAVPFPASSQEWAVGRLEALLRHHEWAEIPTGEGRTVRTFVAYPEKSEKTLSVIVIHDSRGLTDSVRLFADQVAAAGYLAIAPDLLSGFDADHPHTGTFESSDAAHEAIYKLDADQVTRDLLAVREYAAEFPSASGKTVVAGFCWGGSQSFRFATNSPDLAAALVFYGTAPADPERIAAITAPVYGFYGENDHRVNATLPETRRLIEAAGKTYEVEIYAGAGHGFMLRGDDPEGSPEEKKARDDAWRRIKRILAAEQRLSLARESFKAEILGNAATILVDNGDLTLALGTKPGYLELRAIIWADGIPQLGRTAKGERIGDYSALILDLDSDGARTADLDRTYHLNPWPSQKGVFYVTELGGGSTTTLTRERKAEGRITYVKSGGGRTRVDWYSVPLETLPVQEDMLGLCFFASSPVPELNINSVGYAPAAYAHRIPVKLCHRLVLKEGTFFTASEQAERTPP